ncbi:PucR family transcriptional regulator [Microbacterium sp. SSW1-59]|uniref:PucR family transcriptional regulator n=1 Tax=Microbacterium xanthum TaxID=3079794 RepID=UPI002AD1FC80|nr:PucR family transcriptional regulator [Microbacterium sp. SSW1-59]MDZ8200093.1 PucR family transcriptional regulator [Microbacterium sp. SSW1-59]
MTTAAAPSHPTVASLLRRADLSLRDLATADTRRLSREVRWVHSSDLADPTPFLSEGLVLLTTGRQFEAVGVDAYGKYVARLADRGVVGVGFGTEVVREGVPSPLIAACRAASMPLFEVPYRTPFIAVARANAEEVAASSYARRTWALSAQRAIALAALRPDGLGATVSELARQLGAWVGLFDAAGELSRQHPAAGLSAETAGALRTEVGAVLRRGARAGSSLRIGDTPFTLQTLGRGGHLRGVIAIGAGDLDREGRGVVTAVIAMAGLALEQHGDLARARGALRAGVVQSLQGEDSAAARRIARDVWGPMPEPPLAVGLTDAGAAWSDAVAEYLEVRADERRGTLFFGRSEDGLVIVAPASRTEVMNDIADRFGCRIGVASPATYSTFARTMDQARVARDRGDGGVTRFADVARTGILTALDTADARALAAAALHPLVEYDRAHGAALHQTVRAWLDADCSHEATARALGVHRHTVRARLAAAEKALARDLTSFAVRAELWAAFQALDPDA